MERPVGSRAQDRRFLGLSNSLGIGWKNKVAFIQKTSEGEPSVIFIMFFTAFHFCFYFHSLRIVRKYLPRKGMFLWSLEPITMTNAVNFLRTFLKRTSFLRQLSRSKNIGRNVKMALWSYWWNQNVIRKQVCSFLFSSWLENLRIIYLRIVTKEIFASRRKWPSPSRAPSRS